MQFYTDSAPSDDMILRITEEITRALKRETCGAIWLETKYNDRQNSLLSVKKVMDGAHSALVTILSLVGDVEPLVRHIYPLSDENIDFVAKYATAELDAPCVGFVLTTESQ